MNCAKPPNAENNARAAASDRSSGRNPGRSSTCSHMMAGDFVRRCWLAGADTIAVGDLTGIRERIDYTDELNSSPPSATSASTLTLIFSTDSSKPKQGWCKGAGSPSSARLPVPNRMKAPGTWVR